MLQTLSCYKTLKPWWLLYTMYIYNWSLLKSDKDGTNVGLGCIITVHELPVNDHN